jgi:hypothetical protein
MTYKLLLTGQGVGYAITVALACSATLCARAANFPLKDLAAYYFQTAGVTQTDLLRDGGKNPRLVSIENAPSVRVTGGAYDPPPTYFGTLPVGRIFTMIPVSDADPIAGYYFYGYEDNACLEPFSPLFDKGMLISGAPKIGEQRSFTGLKWLQYAGVAQDGYYCYSASQSGPVASRRITTQDDLSFLSPVRRRASDGGEYEASPMVQSRNGVPWATFFWAYRLGLVSYQSDWDPANTGKVPELVDFFRLPSNFYSFQLVSLPPPKIEDDIIEYVNRADFPAQPGGQYFYAVRAEDKTLLDSIPVWQRTGKSFKSGGYVSACRFYGGKNGGPNTHFYSADDKECAALKAIPQLSYEGQTFAVNVPLPGAAVDGVKPCPVASKPLYRVYNNASKSSGRFVSNHRYLTEKADVAAVVAQGWADEGQVMCVPQ